MMVVLLEKCEPGGDIKKGPTREELSLQSESHVALAISIARPSFDGAECPS